MEETKIMNISELKKKENELRVQLMKITQQITRENKIQRLKELEIKANEIIGKCFYIESKYRFEAIVIRIAKSGGVFLDKQKMLYPFFEKSMEITTSKFEELEKYVKRELKRRESFLIKRISNLNKLC